MYPVPIPVYGTVFLIYNKIVPRARLWGHSENVQEPAAACRPTQARLCARLHVYSRASRTEVDQYMQCSTAEEFPPRFMVCDVIFKKFQKEPLQLQVAKTFVRVKRFFSAKVNPLRRWPNFWCDCRLRFGQLDAGRQIPLRLFWCDQALSRNYN